eukprot:4047403-Amphidinium_carterae.1
MLPPLIRVEALLLPSKATGVETSSGWRANWWARWEQSRRHSRGISELCYFFLASYDMLCSLRFRSFSLRYNIRLFAALLRILVHLVTLHLLLIVQGLQDNVP